MNRQLVTSFARRLALSALLAATLTSCGGSDDDPVPPPPPGPPVNGPAWPTFGGNTQHTAIGTIASQPLARILWQTPVDLAPQYGGGGSYLLTHYGSPVISARR